MILIENEMVLGWEAAIRGMRNPKESWEKSDSEYGGGFFQIGDADRKLMRQLASAGSDHSKFMRMITVTIDITAPLFWWAEMDTYKVGTVRNSCSKMHRIQAKRITEKSFSVDSARDDYEMRREFTAIVGICERLRKKYLETGEKRYWRMLIEFLPESYNQKATWQANYAVLRNIYHARRNHKLTEWHAFCDWIEKLPLSWLITGEGDED